MNNKQQSRAIAHTEGPVMVIAGPGTGKTHTLANRVAYMLQSDQGIEPQMILLLTFTEAGVVAMRERLTGVIGAEAYKLNINTFHGFCSEIIQNNPDYFNVRDFEPVSELERIEIAHQIIDELPVTNTLKRLKGDIYYETKRLLNLFQLMKDENWDEAYFIKALQVYLDSLPGRKEYIYQRGNSKKGIKAGDLKRELLKKENERINKLASAAQLLKVYNRKLKELKRYDFSDMLRWVYDAWGDDEFFLLRYQERYQYLLLDEMQDQNRMQFDLVSRLMSYWDKPNIFAVLDPDQTIYEFNGSRINNIIDFLQQYDPEVIFFEDNYRSSKEILYNSIKLITNNQNRIQRWLAVPTILKAATNKGNIKPVIYEFPNKVTETSYIIERIKQDIDNGRDISNIGVIYRKHKLADDLVLQLEARGIPYNMHRSINVLDTIVVQQLLDILTLVVKYATLKDEEFNNILFRILHYRFFDTDVKKIHRYYINLQTDGTRARKPKDIIRVEELISGFVEQYHNVPLVVLLQNIINSSGLLKWVLNSKLRVRYMTYINTFFTWVKSEAVKRTSLNGEKLLSMIDKMKNNGLYLSTIDIQGFNKGVNLMTAHGAKGLEFDTVFLMGANREEWENSRSGNINYKLPDTLTMSISEDKEESSRRLFYVSMTRAKRELIITYPKENDNGRLLQPSMFTEETEMLVKAGKDYNVDEYLKYEFKNTEVRINIEKDLIKSVLDNFVMSVSSLNKYLKCPLTFYYENILRVPFVKTVFLIYGTAIHLVLQRYFDSVKRGKEYPVNTLIRMFNEHMFKMKSQLTPQEFELRSELGARTINMLYKDYFPSANKVSISEYKIRHVEIGGVPCKGDLDKLEFTGNNVDIVDYKTGSLAGVKSELYKPSDKKPNGGNYWRQGTFYKLLFDRVPQWRFRGMRFDVIEEDRVTPLNLYIDARDENIVEKQIKEVYQKIQNAEFPGCGDPDCKWCNLTKNNLDN